MTRKFLGLTLLAVTLGLVACSGHGNQKDECLDNDIASASADCDNTVDPIEVPTDDGLDSGTGL